MSAVVPFMKAIQGLFPVSAVPQSKSVDKIALSTGWWEFDEIYRVYPGQLTVTTGKAGHGKSTFLFNLVLNLCRIHYSKAFLYVPENERFIRQSLHSIYGESDDDFDLLAANNLYVQCSGYEHYNDEPHTIDWILDAACGAMHLYGVDIVLIDPWNEIEQARKKDQSLTDYIGECLRKVKNFCRSTGATVFMVAHPTKAVIDRTTTLYDCEGSAHWVNKMDNGLIVEREIATNSAKVISAKVRERGAGKLGICVFNVDAKTGKFTPQKGAVSF